MFLNRLFTDDKTKRRAWLSALAFCALVALAAAAWHYAFHHYIAHNDYRGDIFRYTYHQSFAPFYMWKYPWSPRDVPAFIAAGLLLIVILLFYQRISAHRLAWLFPVTAWLTLAILFAWSETAARVLGDYAHYNTFANDLHFFSSPASLLQTYVQQQPFMAVHGQHYPPGILWLIMVSGLTGFRITCYVAGTLLILLLHALTCRMGGSRQTALLASSLLAFSPGLLIYPTIDPGVLFSFFTLAAFYCFYSLTQKPSWYPAAGLGICVFVCSMLSYAVFMWGLFPALWLLWRQKQSKGLWLHLAFALLVVVALHVVLYTAGGFNILACFEGSLQRDRAINTLNPFDDAGRYLFRCTGVLLGFALSAGPAWAFSGYVKNKAGIVLLVGIAVLACSGLIFGEAERIFLFLVPYAMLAAAQYMDIRGLQPDRVLALCLLFSLWLELQFQHFA